MSGDLRDRIMEHVDVFEKCGKQQSAAFLREINERLAQLEQQSAKLREEIEDRQRAYQILDAAHIQVRDELADENAKLRERVAELDRDASRGRALRLAKEFLESAVSGEVGDDE